MIQEYTLKEYSDKLAAENQLVSSNIGGAACDSENASAGMLITDITFDSRNVHPGTLFICKGEKFKKEYLESAAEKGAAAYVSETEYDSALPCIIVKSIRRSMAIIANMFYGEPWKSFPLIGLSGTKGKSTTVYYLKSITDMYFAKTGQRPIGYISTIDTFDGVEEFESHLTTPEAFEIGRLLANAEKSRLTSLIMEVSSQGLKLDRTYGIDFKYGVFMNFGIDHIGETEHPTVEDYLQSKLLFFDQCENLLFNMDTDRLEDFLPAALAGNKLKSFETFSPSGKETVNGRPIDYIARNVRKEDGCTVFELLKRNGDCYELISEIRLTMPGLFNVENALVASVLALKLGVPAEELAPGLLYAKAAGRMEVFEDKEREVVVFSDYAHNELSYMKFFESVQQEYPGWRIEALFGCPGGKGLKRREVLPEVTARYADFAWVTEEDPGFDDPAEISEIVAANLKKHGCPCRVIVDRTEAITTAINEAKPKTVIALLAKGRELYMKRGAEYVPIESDSQIAERLINKK